MNTLFLLIFISLLIGTGALATFIWSLGNGQYVDLEGAAERILYDSNDESCNEDEHDVETGKSP